MGETILREQAIRAITASLARYTLQSWTPEQKRWYRDLAPRLIEHLSQDVLRTCVDISKALLSTEETFLLLKEAGLPDSERAIRNWADEEDAPLQASRHGRRGTIKFLRSSVDRYIADWQRKCVEGLRGQVIVAKWPEESIPTHSDKTDLLTAFHETPLARERNVRLLDTEGHGPQSSGQEFRTDMR